MEVKDDIYNNNETFYKLLKQVPKWEGSKKNKAFVEKFIGHCNAEGISAIRKVKYLNMFKQILKWIPVDFDKAERDDIVTLMGKIQAHGYAPASIKDFKIGIKKIYKVLFGNGEEYPAEVRWIKSSIKANEQSKKGHPITEEEIAKIISLSAHPRDKALFSLAFESCCRPAEYLNLKLKDIKTNEHGFEIEVSGKTGIRPVFLIASAPYLAEWLNNHPNRNDSEDYLFVNIGKTNFGKQLKVPAINKALKTLCKRAKIKKKTNLYFLRHSGITDKRLRGISDSALENYAGWVSGSRQMRVYSHLTGRECRDEIERAYGVEKEDKKQKNTTKKCVRCKHVNGFANEYCSTCGTSLDLDVGSLMEKEENQRQSIVVADKLLEKSVISKSMLKDVIKEMIRSGEMKIEK